MEKLQKKLEILVNLYKSKNLLKAELLSNKLIKTYPKVIFLYNILGLILTDLKKVDEAIKCYEKGIEIDPKYIMLYNNLGNIYSSKEIYDKAENYFKKAISINDRAPEPQNNLGNLYLKLNKHHESIKYFKKAINIKANFFIAHYNLGIVYKSIGKFDESKKYLQKAINLSPYFFAAHRALSQITKYKKDDKHFILLQKIYNDKKIENLQKTELAFALGKAFADIKDFKNAFKCYDNGNTLRRKNIDFSIQKETKTFNNIKEIFSKIDFIKMADMGIKNVSPIFILGMPRSGTTLVEQIISSHPDVYGGDELDFLPDLIEKYFCDNKNQNLLKDLSFYEKTFFKNVANEYINKLNKISNNSERSSDKLPVNFKWIGFIKILFPDAKVIHCVRNSKDNCLSIFTNYFINPKLNFAYNQLELSSYYNLYKDLMFFWKSKLTNFIYDVEYENLVSKPKIEIRNLLEKCNLKFNNKCMEFYNNNRVIKTASDAQARKKIYKKSVNSWKYYEKNMKKLFENLN